MKNNKSTMYHSDWTSRATENIIIALKDLKIYLEVNAGKLAEPILKQNKNPKNDKKCHQAFLMLAHLAEIEDYIKQKEL